MLTSKGVWFIVKESQRCGARNSARNIHMTVCRHTQAITEALQIATEANLKLLDIVGGGEAVI
jgi:hypothetical protein